MAEEVKRTVLFELKLDTGDILQKQAALAREIDKTKEVMKRTQEEFGQGSVQYQQQRAELANLQREYKNTNNILQINQRIANSSKGSYEELLNSTKKLEIQLKLMGRAGGENTEAFKKLQAQVSENRSKLISFGQDINDGRLNVGRYAESLGSVRGALVGLAGAFGVTLGLQQITSFIMDSVRASREAEENLNRLKFAVIEVGKEGVIQFQALVQQSEELQRNSIFSDDNIQKAQTQLVNFGLTTKQVKELTPVILDLATASGISLSEATDKVIAGINGQTKGLKDVGVAFEDTGSKTKNLAIVTEQLSKFQGASADALNTTAGATKNLENRFDDLKEKIGGFIDQELSFLKADLVDLGDVLQKQGVSAFAQQVVLNMSGAQVALEQAGGRLSTRTKLIFEKGTQDIVTGFASTLNEGKKSIGEISKAIDEEIAKAGKEGLKSINKDQRELFAQRINALKDFKFAMVAEAKEGLKGAEDLTLKGIKDANDKIKRNPIQLEFTALSTDVEKIINDIAEQIRAKNQAEPTINIGARLFGLTEADKKRAEELFNEAGRLRQLSFEEQLDQINAFESEALANHQLTEDQKTIITQNAEQARTKIREAETQAQIGLAQQAIGNLQQVAKEGSVISKALALFQIALDTAKAVSGATAVSQTVPYPGNLLAMASSITAVLANIIKAKQIIASAVPGFADSGLTGKRITKSDGAPVLRKNGDNILATVKAGEVILNERHQRALGGPDTFKKIGVPGFAAGGVVGSQLGGSLPSTAISKGITNKFELTDLVTQAVKNLPPIVALIQDIERANNIRMDIKNSSTV